MYQRILPIIMIMAVSLSACADSQTDESSQIEAAVEQETTGFIAEARSTLAEIDGGIGELEVDLQEAGEETGAELQGAVLALRTQRDKLKQDLKRLENSGENLVERQKSVIDDRLSRIQTELEMAQLNAIDEREEFEQAIGARLSEADEALSDLRQWTQRAEADLDSTYVVAVTELEQQREELAARIQEMSEASDEAFGEMRQSIAASVAEFNHEVNEALDGIEQKLDTDDLAGATETM